MFWSYAAHAVIYIKNHILKIKDHSDKISYELWTDKVLNLDNMRVWERECWIHLSNKKNKLNSRAEKKIFIDYIKEFNQYLMLLSDRWRIVKTTNLDFKDEEEKYDFSSCKSNNDMQLEKVMKSDNFDNLDFDNESSSSNNKNENKNENENVDENVILSLSSSNSSVSKITFTSTFTSMTVKNRWKWTQKSAITVSIIKDKQISKLSIQEEKYAASKNFFKSKKQTWWNPAVEKIETVKNEAANLIIKFNKFESSKAAELIYKIAFAAKKESNSDQISLSKTL